MSLAVVHSRATVGIDAPVVIVEVQLANGLPAFSIVGLPEAAVRESKDRVRGAIVTCGFEFPQRRITVNLAPANLPKQGGGFDLPIALGILLAAGELRADLEGYEFCGELSLTGRLRPVGGVLAMAVQAREEAHRLVVPTANGAEGALVYPEGVFGAEHLLAVAAHLTAVRPLAPAIAEPVAAATPPDLAEVRGQQAAKRALEVAAAGEHSLLLIGPPGTGKSMLAARLSGLLPRMTQDEALETAAVASVSELGFRATDWGLRPLRAPHHTASDAALIGGGSRPRPGEISLAHNGVLFLDELPEFGRRALEGLREPLETGRVAVSRATARVEFPARFQLIAAMNPCPCGYLGDPAASCRCSAEQTARYRGRLSGPLLDRIDMLLEVPRLPPRLLREAPAGESSAAVRARVELARARQLARAGCANGRLSAGQLEQVVALRAVDEELLDRAVERLGLSARAYHRILRLARTIADLAGRDAVEASDLLEALSYRRPLQPAAGGLSRAG